MNSTKKEYVSTARLGGMQRGQIEWSAESAALCVHYMMANLGDDVSFVPDDAYFRGKPETDLTGFNDVTDRYLESLLKDGTLIDEGIRTWTTLTGQLVESRVITHHSVLRARALGQSGDGMG